MSVDYNNFCKAKKLMLVIIALANRSRVITLTTGPRGKPKTADLV